MFYLVSGVLLTAVGAVNLYRQFAASHDVEPAKVEAPAQVDGGSDEG